MAARMPAKAPRNRALCPLWRGGCAAVLALQCFGVRGSNPFADEIQKWVVDHGYPFEEHFAITEDGVRLALFRLPKPGAPVVHLQHGILDSAWAWVYNTEFKALGFQLYDAGYDVWLGNNRGNSFDTEWANGTSAAGDLSFWNYTFDDMATKGLPALLETVTTVSGQKKVAYIGHSQGTMQFFIAGSTPALQAAVADKVSVFIALSPIAFIKNLQGALRIIAESRVQKLLWPLFPKGFLESGTSREAAKVLCTVTLGLICDVGAAALFGQSNMDSPAAINGYTGHYFPFGTSLKDVVHFAQNILSGQFQRFDYGEHGNMEAYGSKTPPQYTPELLAVPTALFIAEKDVLSDLADVDRLIGILQPGKQLIATKVYPDFSHITWEMGKKEAGYFVADVLSVLYQRHPVSATQEVVV